MEALANPIHTLIAVLAAFLVTEGVKALAARRGLDLSAGVSQIVASLVALIVMVVDPLLLQIPASYAPYIVNGIEVVLAILAAFGIHRNAVRFGGQLTQPEKDLKK